MAKARLFDVKNRPIKVLAIAIEDGSAYFEDRETLETYLLARDESVYCVYPVPRVRASYAIENGHFKAVSVCYDSLEALLEEFLRFSFQDSELIAALRNSNSMPITPLSEDQTLAFLRRYEPPSGRKPC